MGERRQAEEGVSSRATTSIWGESDPSRVSFLNWSKVSSRVTFSQGWPINYGPWPITGRRGRRGSTARIHFDRLFLSRVSSVKIFLPQPPRFVVNISVNLFNFVFAFSKFGNETFSFFGGREEYGGVVWIKVDLRWNFLFFFGDEKSELMARK